MTVWAEQLKILNPIIRIDSIDMMNFQRNLLTLPELKTAFLAPIDSRRLLIVFPESPGAFVRRILDEDILICETSLRLESKSDIPALTRKMRHIHLILGDNTIDCSIIASYWS